MKVRESLEKGREDFIREHDSLAQDLRALASMKDESLVNFQRVRSSSYSRQPSVSQSPFLAELEKHLAQVVFKL